MSGASVIDGWERQEPGWWTKDGVGGICREADGKWHLYPLNGAHEGIGAFDRLRHAIQFARRAVETSRDRQVATPKP